MWSWEWAEPACVRGLSRMGQEPSVAPLIPPAQFHTPVLVYAMSILLKRQTVLLTYYKVV